MTLDFWSLLFGAAIGVATAVIHYRVGWKNIWDNGGDDYARTNGTNPRK